MPDIVVRQLQGEEISDIFYWMPAYAFHASPPLPDQAERAEALKNRQGVTYFALFEDGTPAACAAASSMTQNVRGKLFDMGGIWDVATHPAFRRKGYSRRVLTALLAELRAQGKVFSCLYPFRESFYQRLGYTTFPIPYKVHLTPAPLVPLFDRELPGDVALMLIGDGYDIYLNFMEKLRTQVHGLALFDAPDKAWATRNRFWLAVARVDGDVVGLMMYALKGEQVADFALRAFRFYYTSSQGKYLLLTWLARHADQATEVELWVPPFEKPETWLEDIGVKITSMARAPMGRVLDIAQLDGMYTGSGSFTARIFDPVCPWNTGVWRFDAPDASLRVSRASEADAEFDLTIQGLSALIYGAHAPADFAVRGWGTPSPNQQEKLGIMYPPKQPYLHEFF